MSRRSSVGAKADLTPQLRKMNRISPSRGNASSGLYVMTIGYVDEHPDVPTMWRSRVSRQSATLTFVAFVTHHRRNPSGCVQAHHGATAAAATLLETEGHAVSLTDVPPERHRDQSAGLRALWRVESRPHRIGEQHGSRAQLVLQKTCESASGSDESAKRGTIGIMTLNPQSASVVLIDKVGLDQPRFQ
jgi:hypothetical protein